MRLYRLLTILALLTCCWQSQAQERPLAFPGAEGFGRYTTGGRGGNVYHVTTLEDGNQKGTLRWANDQQGAKTIVFDVSGTIFLKSPLQISPNTTVAGQTAPGDGICVADYPVTVSSNNIIRYMRFRLGNREVAHHEGDGLGGSRCSNVIIDHCSVSWSIDECLSVYGNWDFGVWNQIDRLGNDGTYTEATKDSIRLREPMPSEPVTTHSAQEAYELVLRDAGASLHRDALDKTIVNDVRTGKATYTGKSCKPGIINTQFDVDAQQPWPVLKSKKALKDTDGDGMPDAWELRHQLNPNDASDGNIICNDGYTHFEHYLNGIIN